MDPISLALIAAVSAGVTNSITDGTKASLSASYLALKKKLLEKIRSRHSKVPQALSELEASPKSQGRGAVLAEEIEAAQLSHDSELLKLAQSLMQEVKKTPAGIQIIQSVQNSSVSNSGNATTYNIQGDQHNRR
jgi:hypothetical protein